MGRKKVVEEEPVVDPSAWMVTSTFAELLLMHTDEIRYMVAFGYAFFHGTKLFTTFTPTNSLSYKFVSMVFTCTGGGIMVPVILNLMPVPLSQDFFLIMVTLAFLVHNYFPIVREVYAQSSFMKFVFVAMFETFRASLLCKFVIVASNTIAPSTFTFPLFGPIVCGTLGGCGGAFLPLNKGLGPLLNGPAPPMTSAFLAATTFHLFLNSTMALDVIDAPKKGQFCVTLFFIGAGLANAFQVKVPKGDYVGMLKKED